MALQQERKAQAALEYLMNYAWAIALIVIGVTALFTMDIGGLQTAITTTGSGADSAFGTQFEHVAIQGQRLHGCTSTENCFLDLSFQNNGDQRVNITDITVQELDGDAINTMENRSGTCIFGIDLFPGDAQSCTGVEFDAGAAKEIGDPYDIRIELNYTVLDFDGNQLFFQTPERTIRGQLEPG
jgi:hypothetical protein